MAFDVQLSDLAKADCRAWKKTDPAVLRKIQELILAIKEDPFHGLGHPERLKYVKDGYSRRISHGHRIVYTVKGNLAYVVRCYGHYD